MTPPSRSPAPRAEPRHDWTRQEVAALYDEPFLSLVYEAQSVHRRYFTPDEVQVSALLSVKTGGCPEDCAYCPQSARHSGAVPGEPLLSVEAVVAAATRARDEGASRYCLGAAWRSPRDGDLDAVCRMLEGVKSLGLETCATLGMLDAGQARRLREAGLDYYNHNLDTSPEFYSEIIGTRCYADRLETLENVRAAGLHVCCGGIVGMGESREDRVGLLHALATLPEHPESVPINRLVAVPGTPLAGAEELDGTEFVRSVAVARLLMPRSYVRLSAGRETMSDELQALAFMAGANSIFGGARLLTTPNPGVDRDSALFARLGLTRQPLTP